MFYVQFYDPAAEVRVIDAFDSHREAIAAKREWQLQMGPHTAFFRTLHDLTTPTLLVFRSERPGNKLVSRITL